MGCPEGEFWNFIYLNINFKALPMLQGHQCHGILTEVEGSISMVAVVLVLTSPDQQLLSILKIIFNSFTKQAGYLNEKVNFTEASI